MPSDNRPLPCASDDPDDLCHYVASLDHNESISKILLLSVLYPTISIIITHMFKMSMVNLIGHSSLQVIILLIFLTATIQPEATQVLRAYLWYHLSFF